MGFRFRRSVKLAPGLRLNFGNRGASVSLGGRGATVNISRRGTRTSVGLPGMGLSYSTYTPHDERRAPQSRGQSVRASRVGWLLPVLVVAAVVGISGGLGILLILAAPVVARGLMIALLRVRSSAAPAASLPGSTATGAPVGVGQLAGPGGSKGPGVSLASAAPEAPTGGIASARFSDDTLAALPGRAARQVLPLLEERQRVADEPQSARQILRLAELDAALARLHADIATSPWRYKD